MSNWAAIDLGTNSFHMVVAAVSDDGSFEVLTSEKDMVRLGEGSPGDIAELSEAAMARGIAALGRFRVIAQTFDAAVVAVATSAVREARNGREFVRRARTEAGVDVQVIAGVEEARLIHLGVLQALPVYDQQVLVVDIGGGSTELVIGRAGRELAARSLKIGHLRLTNRFFPDGRITETALHECRLFVRSFLAPTANEMQPLGFDVAIGSSGTATELGHLIRLRSRGATVAAGVDTVIDAIGLDQVLAELTLWRTAEERAMQVEGLAAKRSDVIVGGALLLSEIFRSFGIERMITSPYALRIGLLVDQSKGTAAGAARLSDLRRNSLLEMVSSFEEDPAAVEHAAALAMQLFDQTQSLHGYQAEERELIEAAALLRNVGAFVSHSGHHRHSYYIVRNSDRLLGYTDREIEIIAQVARYHRRSGPKSSHPQFDELIEPDKTRIRWLSGLLRIAVGLDRTGVGAVESVSSTVEPELIHIAVHAAHAADTEVEVHSANQRSGVLAGMAERAVVIS